MGEDLSARLGRLCASASPCLSQLLKQWPLPDAQALRAAAVGPARPRAQHHGFGGFGGGTGRGKGGKGRGVAGKPSGKGWGKGKSGGKGKGRSRGGWGGAGRLGGAAPLKTIAKARSKKPCSTSVVSH